MKLDPRHLIQLSHVVEAENFQIAANRLGLTQPALSRNMKALEDRIGMPLFRRDGRRSIPNEMALRLAKSGFSIRVAQDRASEHAENVVSGEVGELRIGAPPIVAGKFLSQPLAQFLNDNPACTVVLQSGLVDELRSMLERGQIDLVIAPQSLAAESDDLTFRPLVDDSVGILCRLGHPLLSIDGITDTDLRNSSWLAHSRGSLLWQQTEAAMFALGIDKIHVSCVTDSIRSALEIVSDTDLITTMPRCTTEPYLGDHLTFLNFQHPQFKRNLGAIYRTELSTNPTISQFLELLDAV